jgi:hypothetical protein
MYNFSAFTCCTYIVYSLYRLATVPFTCFSVVRETWVHRDGIFKLLRSPGIDSKQSIPPASVAWRAGYDNLIPTRFLAHIDCSKIPAQAEIVKNTVA